MGSFVSCPIFRNLFCHDSPFYRVSPWLVKISMQTLSVKHLANFIVYSVTHLFVRVGRIDKIIVVNLFGFDIEEAAEQIHKSCLGPSHAIV